MLLGVPARTARRIALSILVAASAIGSLSCGKDDTVSLRKFPYPHKAALAICSDIDETETIEKYLDIQRFLNTSSETTLGPGLGLDIGSSFWFYNQYRQIQMDRSAGDSVPDVFFSGIPDLGISLFDGTSGTLSDYASVILDLINAGYADCLHSFGHFSEAGFNRDLALQAIDLLGRESLTVDVFVNHGGQENRNNVGEAPSALGDNPESGVYHTDISIPMGIKFLWRGHVTHCIGQDGNFSILNLAKRAYEYVQDLRYAEQSYPHDNRLVHICELDDGQKVFEFVRYNNPWGKYSIAREKFLTHQLGANQVDDLIESNGYMIFYTHLGTSQETPYLSPSTIDALRHMKKKFDQGDLLVTTTSKLLNYYVHHKHLFWRTENRSDSILIIIDSIANDVEGNFVPDLSDLEGIAFYIPENRLAAIMVNGKPVPSVLNGRDETGRETISIQWQRLVFPDFAHR